MTTNAPKPNKTFCSSEDEQRKRERNAKYAREKYRTDPNYRSKRAETSKKYWREHPEAIIRMLKRQTCRIIKKHHEEMKDDPEHLTTEFIKNLIGINCKKIP